MRHTLLAVTLCALVLGCQSSKKKVEVDEAWLADKLVVTDIFQLDRFWPEIEVPASPADRMMTPAEFRAWVERAEEAGRKACRMQVFGSDELPPASETTQLAIEQYFECLKSTGLL